MALIYAVYSALHSNQSQQATNRSMLITHTTISCADGLCLNRLATVHLQRTDISNHLILLLTTKATRCHGIKLFLSLFFFVLYLQ